MMTFITRFFWLCYGALKQDSFFKHLRGQGLSLRKTLLLCKDYIIAVAKRIYSNKLLEFSFSLFLSIKLSLNLKFVHIKSL